MKGYKTELNIVPSTLYFQSPTADTFETESPLLINFYNGSVDITQGGILLISLMTILKIF